MTTIDDTTYDLRILEQKARDFERQMHGKEWRKMSPAAQDARVEVKALAAKNIAEAYIQTGMAPCMAWPRAIREEILERDSD
jgi:hypothetical protein